MKYWVRGKNGMTEIETTRHDDEDYRGPDKVSGKVHEELIREKTRVEVMEERQRKFRGES